MAEDVSCQGFFRVPEGAEDAISCLDKFQSDGLLQFISGNFLEALYNVFYAAWNWSSWLGSAACRLMPLEDPLPPSPILAPLG